MNYHRSFRMLLMYLPCARRCSIPIHQRRPSLVRSRGWIVFPTAWWHDAIQMSNIFSPAHLLWSPSGELCFGMVMAHSVTGSRWIVPCNISISSISLMLRIKVYHWPTLRPKLIEIAAVWRAPAHRNPGLLCRTWHVRQIIGAFILLPRQATVGG